MTIYGFHVARHRSSVKGIEFSMNLDPDDPSQAYLMSFFQKGECYEQEVAHVMMRVVEPGDLVIDVGANVGFFTLLLSKLVGPTGSVLAFEPGDNTILFLNRNLKLNGMDNVKVVPGRPLWCCEEEVTFYHSLDNSGGNCLWDPALWYENSRSKEEPASLRAKKVAATTLDSFDYDQTPKLIKLDVEGPEQQILEGAEKLLARHPPFVISELNPFAQKQFGNSNESLRAFMKTRGYDCFFMHPNNFLPSLIPPNTTITHERDIAVMNVLFSTLEDVGKFWNRVPYE